MIHRGLKKGKTNLSLINKFNNKTRRDPLFVRLKMMKKCSLHVIASPCSGLGNMNLHGEGLRRLVRSDRVDCVRRETCNWDDFEREPIFNNWYLHRSCRITTSFVTTMHCLMMVFVIFSDLLKFSSSWDIWWKDLGLPSTVFSVNFTVTTPRGFFSWKEILKGINNIKGSGLG